ncbi:hypothetical protein NC651_007522 [Populus alba x Populus x berolinensis]|nr:hypothetical protein NC651_007522 [Populus alba x Populus x berolinensis]
MDRRTAKQNQETSLSAVSGSKLEAIVRFHHLRGLLRG